MDKKLIVFGTRPEFVKLIPVFREIVNQGMKNDFLFIYTGQHADLPKDFFPAFDFQPDISILPKDHDNSIGFSFSYILSSLQAIVDDVMKSCGADLMIGQGDTTTCACAAMCAFFSEIPFAHIEAGLRTYDFASPFPEEYFRRIITLATTVHFAPTPMAGENLIGEGISADKIIVTGNTSIDTVKLLKSMDPEGLRNPYLHRWPEKEKNILITCHRRENQNGRFRTLTQTVRRLADDNPSLNFIWLSHPTLFVQKELREEIFSSNKNIFILPPVDVIGMHYLLGIAGMIITDSGGIQEEAPSFNIPVIVTRELSERKESVDLRYSIIPEDLDTGLIDAFYRVKAQLPVEMINPYGDGKAAVRIVNFLKENFSLRK